MIKTCFAVIKTPYNFWKNSWIQRQVPVKKRAPTSVKNDQPLWLIVYKPMAAVNLCYFCWIAKIDRCCDCSVVVLTLAVWSVGCFAVELRHWEVRIWIGRNKVRCVDEIFCYLQVPYKKRLGLARSSGSAVSLPSRWTTVGNNNKACSPPLNDKGSLTSEGKGSILEFENFYCRLLLPQYSSSLNLKKFIVVCFSQNILLLFFLPVSLCGERGILLNVSVHAIAVASGVVGGCWRCA